MGSEFSAPWGKTLTIMTTVFSLLLIGPPLFIFFKIPADQMQAAWPAILLPIVILIGTALFTIRGYILSHGTLYVKRLFWNTAVPLADLQKVEIVPDAMSKSIRTFGNGGLYSFSGYFKNKTLGKYRAFVTDLKNTVVLTFPNRKIVLSPGNPERFVEMVKSLVSLDG